MNVKEMIEALQKRDPSAPAADALKDIRAEAARSATEALTTEAGIRAAHARIRAHAITHKDKHGVGNAIADVDAIALNGIRSDVFGALAELNPPPPPEPDDDGDPEIAHVRAKIHNKKLWKRADELVAAALKGGA